MVIITISIVLHGIMMDGRTDEGVEGGMANGRTGSTDEGTGGWTGRKTDRLVEGWTDGPTGGRTGRWSDRPAHGWAGGQTGGQAGAI